MRRGARSSFLVLRREFARRASGSLRWRLRWAHRTTRMGGQRQRRSPQGAEVHLACCQACGCSACPPTARTARTSAVTAKIIPRPLRRHRRCRPRFRPPRHCLPRCLRSSGLARRGRTRTPFTQGFASLPLRRRKSVVACTPGPRPQQVTTHQHERWRLAVTLAGEGRHECMILTLTQRYVAGHYDICVNAGPPHFSKRKQRRSGRSAP